MHVQKIGPQKSLGQPAGVGRGDDRPELATELVHLPDQPGIFLGRLIFNRRDWGDQVRSVWVSATAVSPNR
jgi:hypothetical protein